jgi:hypothetical protein
MFILGRQPVEIAENCEGFVASTKRKFLPPGEGQTWKKTVFQNYIPEDIT